MTIAESLNGKRVDLINDPHYDYDYDEHHVIFSDGSKAFRIIVGFEDCEPYIASTTTTMSKKPIIEWKAI